jgi:hypothetical protein
LRAQIGAALRQAPDGHLEGRILAQHVAVIGVRIARRDRQGAEPDHLGDRMANLVRCAGIFDASRQPLGDPQATLHLGQQQNAAIRRQPAAIKTGDNRLAADRQGKINFGVHGAPETAGSASAIESHMIPIVCAMPAALGELSRLGCLLLSVTLFTASSIGPSFNDRDRSTVRRKDAAHRLSPIAGSDPYPDRSHCR